MPLATGTRLGPYEIVASLGAGGMGEVYRARDPKLGRDVAIKVLPESLRERPEALERFEREARSVAALSHPNILSIFELGSAEGRSFAVTELLEGETLRARLAKGAKPLHLLTSEADPFLPGNKKLAAALAKKNIACDLRVLPGPHDQPWLREAGTIEMLLWHDRRKKGK